MKKLALILGICGIMTACTNSNSGSADSTSTSADQSATAQQSNADTSVNDIGTGSTTSAGGRGEELINKSDCLTCHKVDVKLLGPSYQEVAAKYPATEENITLLAGKIIAGGAGNWGDIPMAAHPSVNENDAKEMVKYILSLKK